MLTLPKFGNVVIRLGATYKMAYCREKCKEIWKALLFYFGSEHFCSFFFLSTEFRYCIYQSEEALIACNVKRENFISIGLSENAHGENPPQKKIVYEVGPGAKQEKCNICLRCRIVDTQSGLVPQ